MMADIFNNPSKPFYRFGDIMLLPKIEETRWVDFITSKFAETNKIISKEDARLIAVLMKIIPGMYSNWLIIPGIAQFLKLQELILKMLYWSLFRPILPFIRKKLNL